MQILKGTAMAKDYENNEQDFIPLTAESYVLLCVRFLELLSSKIIIERFTSESPLSSIISPDWGGIKNFEITEKIIRRMKELNTWQGRLHNIQV
jgi:radical SAM superfamily enzyme